MTHVTCRLTAKNRVQLQNTTLGNRVWATFTVLHKPNPELTNFQNSRPAPLTACHNGDFHATHHCADRQTDVSFQDWLHGFPGLFADSSKHICLYFFSFSVLPLFSCWFLQCSCLQSLDAVGWAAEGHLACSWLVLPLWYWLTRVVPEKGR